jgi:hypothetical protein
MNGIEAVYAFGYQPGEEVVADIAGAEVFAVDEGAALAAAFVPPWTIGRIVSRVRRGQRPAYVLAFEHYGARCVCVADETAIAGLA